MNNKMKYITIASALVLGVGISVFSIQHNKSINKKIEIVNSMTIGVQASGIAAETNEKSVIVLPSEKVDKADEVKKTPEIVEYVIKSGDTFSSIAKQYGIDVDTIMESNNLNPKSVLIKGQNLTFPTVKGAIYKVREGENLWDIANSYNINVNSIVDVNALGAPDKVKIGQVLILPGAKKIVTANSDSNVSGKKTSLVKMSTNRKTTKTKTVSRTYSISRGARSTILSNVSWPVRGPITSGFGYRGDEFHTGTDIGVPTGTQVRAAMGGTVEFVGWDGGYGNLVIINNGSGVRTYYGHNSKLLVHVGQVVDRGDVISLSGSTGRSTGPHVHFEIRINNKVVNPLSYL